MRASQRARQLPRPTRVYFDDTMIPIGRDFIVPPVREQLRPAHPLRERRRRPRHGLAFPIAVITQRGRRLGVTRNFAQQGMLLSVNGTLHLGEPIEISFHAGGPDAVRLRIAGQVLRIQKDNHHPVFPSSAAILFRSSLPDEMLHALLRELSVYSS